MAIRARRTSPLYAPYLWSSERTDWLTLQTPDDARAELAGQLDELLNTLSNKFAGVSSEIFAKSMYTLSLH